MAISEQLQALYAQGNTTLFIPVYGIGDALLSTVAIKQYALRQGKPVLVSHKNLDLFENNPYVIPVEGMHDMRISLDQIEALERAGFTVIYPTYWNFIKNKKGSFDLVYPTRHIIAETCAKAGISGIVELVPEIYLTECEKKAGRFVASDKKQIAVMSTAIDRYKQWNQWQELVSRLRHDYVLIQVGAATDVPLAGALDLRGKLSLRQVAAVLSNVDLFLGQIGGLMHVARAVGTRSVIAYSGAEPTWFASYRCNVNVHPEQSCTLCAQPGKSPHHVSCAHDYCCINSIAVDKMEQAVSMALANRAALEVDRVSVVSERVSAATAYAQRYSFVRKGRWASVLDVLGFTAHTRCSRDG